MNESGYVVLDFMTIHYNAISNRLDVTHEMKLHLPEYIFNCFMVAGYDSVDAICSINDQSITEIKQYIEKI